MMEGQMVRRSGAERSRGAEEQLSRPANSPEWRRVAAVVEQRVDVRGQTQMCCWELLVGQLSLASGEIPGHPVLYSGHSCTHSRYTGRGECPLLFGPSLARSSRDERLCSLL